MPSSNPRLLCRTGEFAGITCDVGSAATLGRGSSNDVVIPSPQVSTSHARIYQEEEEYFVEDLDSSNGTRVDGMEVRGRVRLEGLHVITIAEDIDFIFAPSAADGAGARPHGSPDPTKAATVQPGTTPQDAPPQQPPGAGTEVIDASAWGELPDLEAPEEDAQDDDSTTPDAPQQPPGQGTQMIDASAWGDLPDLEPAEEEERSSEPEPEEDLEHGRTVMQEGLEPLPDLGEGEPEPEPEPDLEHGRTVMDQEVQPLPDLDAPGEGSPEQEPEPAPVPAPVPLPELAVALPGRPLKTYALKEGENIIGRSESCDITIIDPENQISRKHAVLNVSAEGITLTDSASANGTFVDGQQVETADLTAGNSFRLGPNLECTLLQR